MLHPRKSNWRGLTSNALSAITKAIGIGGQATQIWLLTWLPKPGHAHECAIVQHRSALHATSRLLIRISEGPGAQAELVSTKPNRQAPTQRVRFGALPEDTELSMEVH
jgi:hypothetical protein